MELQDFIKNTLVDITNGIIGAQQELKNTGCLINPTYNTYHSFKEEDENDNFHSIQKVKMNIVLNVTEGTGSKSRIGVAQIINAGIGNEKSNVYNQVTSIEFEVPVAFPIMKV